MFLDASDGHQFMTTRVTLKGHPEYTFHTPADMDAIAVTMGVIDVTAGVNPGGNPCLGDTGVIATVSVDLEYPMLKLLRIENKIYTKTVEYVCNPNELLWAEEHYFQDDATQLPAQALMITFTGASVPRRVLTKLSFADLSALLEPDIV